MTNLKENLELRQPCIYKRLPINILKIDNTYQRPLSRCKVNRMVKNFNEGYIGAITVSCREDGFYYVLDGQHRLETLKYLCIDYVMCQIHHDLSFEEEALMFRNLNSIRSNPTAPQIFKASLIGNDQEAITIKSIIEKNGLKISTEGRRYDGLIGCVHMIQRCYRSLKDEKFDRMLKLIYQTWEGEADSLIDDIFGGMSVLVREYGDQINDDVFVKKMSKISPTLLSRACTLNMRTHGGGPTTNMAKALIHEYNKGLRTDKKI